MGAYQCNAIINMNKSDRKKERERYLVRNIKIIKIIISNWNSTVAAVAAVEAVPTPPKWYNIKFAG